MPPYYFRCLFSKEKKKSLCDFGFRIASRVVFFLIETKIHGITEASYKF